MLSPRIDLINPKPKHNPKAERAFLASLPAKEAVQVAGSQDKLQRILSAKETLEDVYNQGKDELYKWKRVGDAAPAPGGAVPSTPAATSLPLGTRVVMPDVPPVTAQDYQSAGRLITDTLPDGSNDPEACFNELLKRLDKEVGISTPCQVKSKGEGAKLVKEASQRYPDSWTKATDAFGPLYAKSRKNARGYYLSLPKSAPPSGRWKLKDFEIVPHEDGAGYILMEKGGFATAIHEYAHRLQTALPGLDKLFQDLHKGRTAGDPLKSLKSLRPELAYRPNEITREDKYIDPYQGKEYGDGDAREVITMAFQYVLGLPKGHRFSGDELPDFRKLYKEDRAMFDFTVGVLFHWRPKP